MNEFSYFPVVLNDTLVKNSSANAGDTRGVGLIPGSGRFPGVGNGRLLHYSCQENPLDRGGWAIVHGVQIVWQLFLPWDNFLCAFYVHITQCT